MTSINITKLDNGIRVVSEHLPYVESFSLGFWFNVGSRDEVLANNGISHFLEHMFFKGTNKRSAKKIADDIESLGGYLNAFTSKEHTCLYGRGLKNHFAKTFEVLADMAQYSVFSPNEIEKEANVIVDELNDIEDSPEELIFDEFETAVFKGSKLAMPIIGTEENIRSFTRDDLFNYIDRKYSFENMYIIASGNVDHNQLIKLAEKYVVKDFGKCEKRKNGFKVKPAKNSYTIKEIQQAHVIIGQPTVGFKDFDRTAVNLLSHILGEGSSSRLFYSVREKHGITYQINSFLNSFYDVSSFGVYFSTNEKLVEKAQKLIYKEFDKMLSKEISSREINKSKEAIKGNILMSLESTTNRMMRMGQSMLYFNRVKPVQESIDELNAVDENKLHSLGTELLNRELLTEIIIGSENFINEISPN